MEKPPTPTRIALIGPPGSGKTTLASSLVSALPGCVRVRTSDGFKGRADAEAYMARGELVPASIGNGCLTAQLEAVGCGRGWVLDGYPRYADNVRYLEANHPPDLYVLLDGDDALCRRRVSEREEKRSDDVVVERRLEVYRESLTSLVAALPAGRVVTAPSEGPNAVAMALAKLRVLADGAHPPVFDPSAVRIGVQAGRSAAECQVYARARLVAGGEGLPELVELKPRDTVAALRAGLIDVLVAEDDCVDYADAGDDVAPVFEPELPHPGTPMAGSKRSRIALVHREGGAPDETELRIVSDYGEEITRRLFPSALDVFAVHGSAEKVMLSARSDDGAAPRFNAALVVVETGATLSKLGMAEGLFVRYLQPNVYVNLDTKAGVGAFRALTDRTVTLVGAEPSRKELRNLLARGLGLAAPPQAWAPTTFSQFEALPLVIRGHSKEVRYLGNGLVVIRFIPTVYSYTHNRADTVEGTARPRLEASMRLVDVLAKAGVPHAYKALVRDDDGEAYVLAQLVMPHDVEFAKYGLPPFCPYDLTEAQLARLPRAPPIEVIVKQFHSGTGAYPTTLVRFDWRNPIVVDGARVPDEILPEPFANHFIDVGRASKLAKRAAAALSAALASVDIVGVDVCLFIDESGGLMYGELGPDCGRFRHFDLGSLDKDVWRSGGSSAQVVEKWNLLAEHVARIRVPPAVSPVEWRREPIRMVLGTTNPGKAAEFASMLFDIHLELATVSRDVPEPHGTFRENARAKLDGYSDVDADVLVVEDSGLVVDALGGAPGVRSARYTVADEAAETRTRAEVDRDNNARVLAEMRGVKNRAARFYVCALARIRGQVHTVKGVSEGAVALEARGANGFGYDPIFENASGSTYAELDAVRKNLVSHRRRVITEIRALILKHAYALSP